MVGPPAVCRHCTIPPQEFTRRRARSKARILTRRSTVPRHAAAAAGRHRVQPEPAAARRHRQTGPQPPGRSARHPGPVFAIGSSLGLIAAASVVFGSSTTSPAASATPPAASPVTIAPTPPAPSPPDRVSRKQRLPLRAEGAGTPAAAAPAPVPPAVAATTPPVSPTPPAPVVTAVLPTVGSMTSCYCTRWGSFHTGVDVAGPLGSPIYAAMTGRVVQAGPATGFGNWVVILQTDGSYAVYGHMRVINVTQGQIVAAGQQVALIGNEGQSTGPHLHFEIRTGSYTGSSQDPLSWLRKVGVDAGSWKPFTTMS